MLPDHWSASHTAPLPPTSPFFLVPHLFPKLWKGRPQREQYLGQAKLSFFLCVCEQAWMCAQSSIVWNCLTGFESALAQMCVKCVFDSFTFYLKLVLIKSQGETIYLHPAQMLKKGKFNFLRIDCITDTMHIIALKHPKIQFKAVLNATEKTEHLNIPC